MWSRWLHGDLVWAGNVFEEIGDLGVGSGWCDRRRQEVEKAAVILSLLWQGFPDCYLHLTISPPSTAPHHVSSTHHRRAHLLLVCHCCW